MRRLLIVLSAAVLAIGGCGGDDEGGDSKPAPASIGEVEDCLEGEGLEVTRRPGLRREQIGSLRILLQRGDSIDVLVTFYHREDDAKSAEEFTQKLTDREGGEVERRETVVYSVLYTSADDEFRTVEDCL